MNLTELSTIGHYGIPVIVVIFNNGTLGMVRQWQTLFFGHRYSQTTLDRGPDFMKLADGLRAERHAGEYGGDVCGGVPEGGRGKASRASSSACWISTRWLRRWLRPVPRSTRSA